MTPERWERVKSLFERARELPPAERAAFLASECADDPSLIPDVERLSDAADRAGGFLEGHLRHVDQTFLPGDLLAGKYRIERLIGRGGMGEVYRAHHAILGEAVAVKTLRADVAADPEYVRRFMSEMRLAQRITHPNVCRLFDVGIHEFPAQPDSPARAPVRFFTMELVEGETLAERIRRGGPLSAAEAFPLIVQMAEALQAAHAVRVIHRDFKSGNVMLSGARAVVTDFGIARADGITAESSPATTSLAAGTRPTDVMGTSEYSSPEQLASAEVTPASDIYSFGIVLFEMATGRLPFEGHIIQVAMQRAAGKIPQVRALQPSINPQWESAIQRCLQTDPAMRPSAASLVSEFRPGAFRLPRVYWTRRRWAGIAVAAAISLGGVASLPRILRLRNQSATLPEGAEATLGTIMNATGDMQFDGITELFRSQLAQSAHLNLVEPDDLLNALSEMGKRVDSPTSEDLQEASWRLNVPVAIFGTLTQVGPDYALSIQLETRGPEPQNPSSKTLKSFGASDPAGLMRSVRDASVWIRETLGESEESISAADRLPVNVTTPSWEALAFYARAERQAVNRKFEEALLMLDSALDRDGQFALAALRKADILMSLNRQLEGLIQWRKAIGLLDRRPITRREELHARGMYAFDTGDLSQAGRYFASWAVEYPNDYRGWFYQAVPLMLDGHAREAITSLERVVKMMPGFGSGYAQLVHTHNLLGERDQALQWVQRFRAVGPRERCDITEASIHFAASDYTRTIQLLQRARSSDNPYTRSLAIVSEAIVWIELGAYQRAAALIEGSFALMDSTKSQGQAADAQATLAWAFLLAGDKKRAAKAAAAALSIDSGPLALVQAATVCIRAGRPDLAAPAVERCREFSDMPCYQFAASRMAGETAALEGRSDEAISALRRAAGIEPKLAFRDYLAEVFPPGHSERLEIQNKIAGLAPLVLRVPLTQTPGSFGRTMMDLHKRSPDVRTAAHLNSVRSALAAFPNSPI